MDDEACRMREFWSEAGSVVGLLYRSPGRYGFLDDDDASEAILRYWKRILRATTAATGESGAYADGCLRWIAKSMRRRRRRSDSQDLAGTKAEEWRLEDAASPWAAEPPSQYSGGDSPESGGRESFPARAPAGYFLPSLDAYSRRILFLFLKCAYETSEADALMVSRRIGVPFPWLCARADDARTRLDIDRARLERLRNRANAVWLRLRLLESTLSAECEPDRRSILAEKIARDRRRYSRLRARIRSRRIVVPNSAIAAMLGVPKGTVDSGLYYLRERALAAMAGPGGGGALPTGRRCG